MNPARMELTVNLGHDHPNMRKSIYQWRMVVAMNNKYYNSL